MTQPSQLTTHAELRRDGAIHPIVPGLYPDPTICQVGKDYYLAHSSFEYFPGAPIFHSRDLLEWTQIGNILTKRDQFRRGDAKPSGGIYAGTLRHREGRFWFITTNVSDYDAGQLIVHTEDPAGEWSDPIHVPEAVGIDPDICWDAAGQCYLTWHTLNFATGEQDIRQAPINLETGRFMAEDYPIWQGIGLAAAEGPHLYKIGDYWYLLLAEGGTERGHCITVARSISPAGPFESCPSNPIFSHRSTVHPVQNVGHADLVQTPQGDWAAVYLGVRARGSTPGFHVLGRESFLAGIDWKGGWPVFDTERFDLPNASTEFVDDFSADRLDPRWVTPAGDPAAIAQKAHGGGISLLPAGDDSGLLCSRVRDLRWTAEVTVEESGRFLLRVDDRHWYGISFEDGRICAQARIGGVEQVYADVSAPGRVVALRIQAVSPSSLPVPVGDAGPDVIVLSYVDRGHAYELARLDGRYLSTEVASGFTGRVIAVAAGYRPAHIHSIVYAGHQD